MKTPDSPARELFHTLHEIRWVLRGYLMAGVQEIGRPSEMPAPAHQGPKPEPVMEDADCGFSAGTTPPPAESPSVTPSWQAPAPATQGISSADAVKALAEIQEDLAGCTRCRLHEGRTNLVFGEGSPRAPIVFVGEGPGFEEDQQGRPFVGRAGKLLDKMIQSLGMQRYEIYICNVVKCRPPGNRTPQRDEIQTCFPFLAGQLTALSPKVICALGACAAQTLLATDSAISRLRGSIHRWRGVPLVCTFHPAYLLRNPGQKGAAWQDLLRIQAIVHEALLEGRGESSCP